MPDAVSRSSGRGHIFRHSSHPSPRSAAAWSMPSRTSMIPIFVPANSRSQLSRIVSNTGDASEIELLIADSTSPEARCWSSASLVSLNRRAFWIAMTACSANVRSSASCLSENAPLTGRPTQSVPIARPSDSMRRERPSRRSHRQAAVARPLAACRRASTSGKATTRRSRIAMPDAVSRSSGAGNICPQVLVVLAARWWSTSSMPSSRSIVTPTVCPANRRWQLARITSNTGFVSAIELRDRREHLAGRALLVERFLRLVEQPHVVDRDRGLAREGLEQRDLVGRERARLARARSGSRRRRRLRASAAPPARRGSRSAAGSAAASGYSVVDQRQTSG